MKIKNISDFRKAVRHGPYAWPGGYPVYFLMADGEAISFNAAKKDRRACLEALRANQENQFPDKDWLPVAMEINWTDGHLYCAASGERIESAYAEPEEESEAA
jgi:hypothetical protein